MTKILPLQGANLTFLGRREPDKRSIHCVLSDAAEGVIGMHSYILGPDAMLGLRTHIDRHDAENDRCSGSNRPRRRAALFLRSWIHSRPFSFTLTPTGDFCLSRDPLRGLRCVAAGDVCPPYGI